MARIVTVTTRELDLTECVEFLHMLNWSAKDIVLSNMAANEYSDYTMGGVKVMGRARGTRIARFVQFQVQEAEDA